MSTYSIALPSRSTGWSGFALRAVAAATLAVPFSLAGQQFTHPAAVPLKTVASTPHLTAAAALARLPVRFEALNSRAGEYVVRGAGFTALLGSTGMVFDLPGGHGPAASLLGANPAARATALDRQPGQSNYMIGGNRDAWRLGVPNFARVRYANVYPGIDALYYGANNHLEYDFVVGAGANPARIQLAFSGAVRPALNQHGDLVLKLSGGTLTEHSPLAFQPGAHGRVTVPVRFVLRGGHVGFALGSHNPALPVTIDPTLAYSTFLGGSLDDQGNAIAAGSDGTLYVTGATASPDFPVKNPGLGFSGFPNTGQTNAFVTKINPDGSLAFSTYLGGCGNNTNGDSGRGIAIDSTGNMYVTGGTYSSPFPDPTCPFPVTVNAYQQTNNDESFANSLTGSNAFLSKISPDGRALLYSTYLGGSDPGGRGDVAFGVAVDGATGNAYIAGTTYSTDFPVSPGAFQGQNNDATNLSGNPGAQAFVAELSTPTGGTHGALLYSTYLGGSDTCGNGDGAFGIALDSSLGVYITGFASSHDFPTTPGAFQTVNKATIDPTTNCPVTVAYSTGFVSKLNPARSGASSLVYSTFLGGLCDEVAFGVAVDVLNEAYVTGETCSTDFPITRNAYQKVNKDAATGGFNAFVTRMNSTGTGLIYSTYLGGSDPLSNGDGGQAIAVDATGAAYVTGFAQSTDFPSTTTLAAHQSSAAVHASTVPLTARSLAGGHPFPADKELVAHFGLGGHGRSRFHANGVTGATSFSGIFHAFVSKLFVNGRFLIYSTVLGGDSSDQGNGIAVGSDGTADVTGFTRSQNFPITSDTAFDTQLNQGNTGELFLDGFVTSLGPKDCIAFGVILAGNQRLGIANTATGGIFYLTLQTGGSSFVLRNFDTYSCTMTGSVATLTITHTLTGRDSPRGVFAAGQKVTITITVSMSGLVSATVVDNVTGTYTLIGSGQSRVTVYTD